jgi:hypothetical protein
VSGGGSSAAVPVGFAVCAPRKGEGGDDWDFGEVIELSGRVFQNTRDFSRWFIKS